MTSTSSTSSAPSSSQSQPPSSSSTSTSPSTTSTSSSSNSSPPPATTPDCRRCSALLATTLLGSIGIGSGSGSGGVGTNLSSSSSTSSSPSSASGPGTLLRAMGATARMVGGNDGLAGGGGGGNATAQEAVVTIPIGGRRSLLGSPSVGSVSGSSTDKAAMARRRRLTETERADTTTIVEVENDDHSPPDYRGEGGGGGGGLLSGLRRRLTGTLESGGIIPGVEPILTPPLNPVATSALPPQSLRNADGTNDANDNPTQDDQSISVSISCQPCGTTGPEGGARAYVKGPHPLSVVLCSNRLTTSTDISEVLIHELTHVYDVRIRNFDLRDCDQLAYSEVRAARNAECANSLTKFTERLCVRERAGVATNNMFPGRVGRECVGRVFERAMADRAPFSGGQNCSAGRGGSSSGGFTPSKNASSSANDGVGVGGGSVFFGRDGSASHSTSAR